MGRDILRPIISDGEGGDTGGTNALVRAMLQEVCGPKEALHGQGLVAGEQ